MAGKPKPLPTQAFIRENIVQSGDCWLWTRAKDRKGYGHIHRRGQTIAAHRLSYELFVGPIPNGMVLLHSCDTPACVNPSHLKPGTNADNLQDMWSKNRGWRGGAHKPACGSQQHRAKLTERDIPAIRARIANGEFQRNIGADYGVPQSAISKIARGINWKHV